VKYGTYINVLVERES